MEIKWSVISLLLVSCCWFLGYSRVKKKLSSEERESIVDTNIWFELAEKRTVPRGEGQPSSVRVHSSSTRLQNMIFFVNIFSFVY